MSAKVGDTWYRYVNRHYGSGVKICCDEYTVRKVTPKGVWLEYGPWVAFNTRKRYAYPTKELALDSFIRRKEWQVRHLTLELEKAKEALKLVRAGKFQSSEEIAGIFSFGAIP